MDQACRHCPSPQSPRRGAACGRPPRRGPLKEHADGRRVGPSSRTAGGASDRRHAVEGTCGRPPRWALKPAGAALNEGACGRPPWTRRAPAARPEQAARPTSIRPGMGPRAIAMIKPAAAERRAQNTRVFCGRPAAPVQACGRPPPHWAPQSKTGPTPVRRSNHAWQPAQYHTPLARHAAHRSAAGMRRPQAAHGASVF